MSRSTVVFSCLGHLYIHLFMAFYFVIVLALEAAWRLPYQTLIGLWTVPSLLLGMAALPAGMLADRIGSKPMMVLFFVGMGASSIAAGFVGGPAPLLVCLCGIGLFGSIYHPVGIPWLVRNAGAARGKALGFNGVFGALGTAAAALVAGTLIAVVGWRAAFVVPGVVSVATGLALALWRVDAAPAPAAPEAQSAPPDRGAMLRTFSILLVSMFLTELVYHGTQTALPKLFELRDGGFVGGGAFGVGLLVAIVYTAGGTMQIVGGHLADRFPLKPVYVSAFVVQAPLLWLAGSLAGPSLVAVASFMVMASVGALPAENMLLARNTPEGRHGLVFGLKFVLVYLAAPLAIQIVAFVSASPGGFRWVFAAFAAFAAGAALAALALPRERPVALAPQPAAGD